MDEDNLEKFLDVWVKDSRGRGGGIVMVCGDVCFVVCKDECTSATSLNIHSTNLGKSRISLTEYQTLLRIDLKVCS